MSDAVQVALISGLCVAIPTLITNYVSNRNNRTLMNYRLDQIEKKQDKIGRASCRERVSSPV